MAPGARTPLPGRAPVRRRERAEPACFLAARSSAGNRQASAAAFGPFLATGYDALKDVDPTITVVGVGLSPRGNDRPAARSNVSTSPVRFLAALGAWYRASGRSRPLMDGLSFHPYPNVATDPLDRGYAWPNAGFVNLDRIKQAVWDAFSGTPQPTTLEGLRLYLDEVGWQVDTSGAEGYLGTENVRVTDEASQAAIYGELLRRAACDPDIAQVNVFGFRDDALRSGFQAGLNRVDGTPRPSADAVRAVVAMPGCADRPDALASRTNGARREATRRAGDGGRDRGGAHGGRGGVRTCVPPRRGLHAFERRSRPGRDVRRGDTLSLDAGRPGSEDDAVARAARWIVDRRGQARGGGEPGLGRRSRCDPCAELRVVEGRRSRP